MIRVDDPAAVALFGNQARADAQRKQRQLARTLKHNATVGEVVDIVKEMIYPLAVAYDEQARQIAELQAALNVKPNPLNPDAAIASDPVVAEMATDGGELEC